MKNIDQKIQDTESTKMEDKAGSDAVKEIISFCHDFGHADQVSSNAEDEEPYEEFEEEKEEIPRIADPRGPLTECNSLLNSFFHSLGQDGQVEWQGVVLASPEPGWYLIQLFEFMFGTPSVRRLKRLEEMKDWLFYSNNEEMIHSYEYGTAREGGPYRRRL